MSHLQAIYKVLPVFTMSCRRECIDFVCVGAVLLQKQTHTGVIEKSRSTEASTTSGAHRHIGNAQLLTTASTAVKWTFPTPHRWRLRLWIGLCIRACLYMHVQNLANLMERPRNFIHPRFILIEVMTQSVWIPSCGFCAYESGVLLRGRWENIYKLLSS